MRPHSKRVRRRSSRLAIDFGARSDEMTIWPPSRVELVERVEELLLELLGALEELDVVDEQDVEVAVAALEAGHLLGPDGVDELVHERLGGDVAHPLVPEHGADVVADRVQEVGLAEAGGTVDEQRVVGAAGALGDRQRGGVREAVRGADHELVEGVAGVQRARGPGARRPVVGRVGERDRAERVEVVVLDDHRHRRRGHGERLVFLGRGLDEELDAHRHPDGVTDRVGEHARVARTDPFRRQRAGHAEQQALAVVAEGPDAVEPCGPGGGRELVSEGRRTLVPDVVGRQRSPFFSPRRAGCPAAAP